MARFFIDVRDNNGISRDDEGAEFERLEDALEEAKASARDLIHQYVKERISMNETCVEVRDETGRVVASLSVAEVLDHPTYPAFKQNCSDTPRAGHR